MDIRKKLFSIVGVLVLTMSMTAGMGSAQTTQTDSGSVGLTFTVACGTGAPGAASAVNASFVTNDPAIPVAFPMYDPATDETGIVSTADNAFRVKIDVTCPFSDWSVSSNITDFTDGPLSFPGSTFQLVHAGGQWTGANGPVQNVNEASSPVTYSGTAPVYSSPALATATGATLTNGSMYMDFTGQLVGLDSQTIEDGDYTATLTLTVNPGSAP